MPADTTAPATVRACTCGHPEGLHNARRPAGACTACTQCSSLLAGRPHAWHRCRCEAFDPAPRNAIEAEIAGDLEVLEPSHPTGANNATD